MESSMSRLKEEVSDTVEVELRVLICVRERTVEIPPTPCNPKRICTSNPAFPKGNSSSRNTYQPFASLRRSQLLLAEKPMHSACNPKLALRGIYTLGYLKYHTINIQCTSNTSRKNFKPDPVRKTSDPAANACSYSTPYA